MGYRGKLQEREEARRRRPSRLTLAKQAEIGRLLHEGRERIGTLAERDLLVAGAALYAGEGGKSDGRVTFANTNAHMIALFCAWLRHFFEVDESRLRGWLYLHAGLDLEEAVHFWSHVSGIPPTQFGKPYRAEPRVGIRTSKHRHGCFSVAYSCSRTHRAIMGLVQAIITPDAWEGYREGAHPDHPPLPFSPRNDDREAA